MRVAVQKRLPRAQNGLRSGSRVRFFQSWERSTCRLHLLHATTATLGLYSHHWSVVWKAVELLGCASLQGSTDGRSPYTVVPPPASPRHKGASFPALSVKRTNRPRLVPNKRQFSPGGKIFHDAVLPPRCLSLEGPNAFSFPWSMTNFLLHRQDHQRNPVGDVSNPRIRVIRKACAVRLCM